MTRDRHAEFTPLTSGARNDYLLPSLRATERSEAVSYCLDCFVPLDKLGTRNDDGSRWRDRDDFSLSLRAELKERGAAVSGRI